LTADGVLGESVGFGKCWGQGKRVCGFVGVWGKRGFKGSNKVQKGSNAPDGAGSNKVQKGSNAPDGAGSNKVQTRLTALVQRFKREKLKC
jgi:hypothetical protein